MHYRPNSSKAESFQRNQTTILPTIQSLMFPHIVLPLSSIIPSISPHQAKTMPFPTKLTLHQCRKHTCQQCPLWSRALMSPSAASSRLKRSMSNWSNPARTFLHDSLHIYYRSIWLIIWYNTIIKLNLLLFWNVHISYIHHRAGNYHQNYERKLKGLTIKMRSWFVVDILKLFACIVAVLPSINKSDKSYSTSKYLLLF